MNRIRIYHCCICDDWYFNSNGYTYRNKIPEDIKAILKNMEVHPSSGFCSKECYEPYIKESGLPKDCIDRLLLKFDEGSKSGILL